MQRRWVEGIDLAAEEEKKKEQRAGATAGGFWARQRSQQEPAEPLCDHCGQRYRCAWNCTNPTQPREADPEEGFFDDYRQSVIDMHGWLSGLPPLLRTEALRRKVGQFFSGFVT